MIKRRANPCLLLASTAAATLTFAAHPVAAQTASDTAKASEVQEVVVTATRRSEGISKVPESVSAFTAAKMDVQGVKSFADIARLTPGVTYDEASHNISIRGIASSAGSATTGIYIDDTPIQTRALGFNANNSLPVVFDLDRVEVLRGPQGTLFGAGAEGGAVRYISAQPSLTTASGLAHVEFADSSVGAPSYEAGLAAGGPIQQDVLGFRVSAWARRDGGFIDRVDDTSGAVTDKNANWVDTASLRGALAWAPLPGLLITPTIDWQNRQQHNYDDYWVSISDPGAGRYRTGTPDRMADYDRFVLPTVKVEYDAGGLNFISNTALYDRKEVVNGYSGTLYNLSYFQQLTGAGTDPQGSPCASCAGDPSPLLTPTGRNLGAFGPYVSRNITTNTQQNFSQEFRLQSDNPNARLTWVAGLFIGYDTQRSREEINDPQLPDLTQFLWGEDMLTAWGETLLPNGDSYDNNTLGHDTQTAVFFEGTAGLTDQIKLTLGARYAWTRFDYTNATDGPQELLDNGGVPQTASGAKSETPFTPKIGLTDQLTKDDLIYITAAEGYRIGGATPPLPSVCGGPFPSTYASDTVDSFEAGSKDALFGRTLHVAASVYYVRWKNIQQDVYVPTCGLQYTTNLGTAVSEGFDLQANWRPTPSLTFDLAAGYDDARYTSDAVSASGDVLAVKGDSLGGSPWTVSIGAEYRLALMDHAAFVRLDDDYGSRRTRPLPGEDIGTVGYDPGLVPDPAVNQLNLRGGVSFERWEMAVFANNMLDAHPQLGLNHQDQFTVLYEATTLRPRTIGVSFTARY